MSAALSRIANPAADLGHAGPEAPVLDDPRFELARSFMADLPAQLIRLQAINARLEATLAKVFEEVREFPDSPPESSDSYLPPHLVVEIAEALHYARAR